MSIRVMSLVWDHAPLHGGKLLTFLALADYAGDDGGGIFPMIKELADKTRVDERTARRHVTEFQKAGFLILVKEARQHAPREYRIDLAALCSAGRSRGDKMPVLEPSQGGQNARPESAPGGTLESARGDNSSPTHLTVNNRHKESVESHFEEFWQACPRKVGKLAARRDFAKAVKQGLATAGEITMAMRRHAARVADKDAQYVPHPSTWLNEGRYLDDVGVDVDVPVKRRLTPAQERLSRIWTYRAGDDSGWPDIWGDPPSAEELEAFARRFERDGRPVDEQEFARLIRGVR